MSEHLADVVQETAPLGQADVQVQLGGHHSGQPCHLFGMVEDVLAVRRTIAHPADQLDQLGVEPVNAGVVGRLLAHLHQLGVQLALNLEHNLFDPSWMNPAVGDEGLERAPGDFPPNGVEAGDDHRVGGVVDDHINTGSRLECPDIAALSPDDAAFHLVARQRHSRNGALSGMLGAESLDGDGDDAAGITVGGAAGLFLDLPDEGGPLAPGPIFDALKNFLLCLLGGEPGNPLQLGSLLLGQAVGLALAIAERLLPLSKGFLAMPGVPLAGLDLLQLSFLSPGALLGPALQPFPFLAAALDLAVEILPQLEGFHLGAEEQVGLGGLGVALAFSAQPVGFSPGECQNAAAAAPLTAGVEQDEHQGSGQSGRYPREQWQEQRLEHRLASGCRAITAFGRWEQPGQIVGHGRDSVGELTVAAPSLEQLIGDGESGKNGGLVRLHHGETVAYPLQGSVEIRGHFTGVLGRHFGPDGIFLASDEDSDCVFSRGHAAVPPPCCSRNETRPANARSRSLAPSIRSLSAWFSVSSSMTRWRAWVSSGPASTPPFARACCSSPSAFNVRLRQPASSSARLRTTCSRSLKAFWSGRS